MLPRLAVLRTLMMGTLAAFTLSLAPVLTQAASSAPGAPDPASLTSGALTPDADALNAEALNADGSPMTVAQATGALETAERVVQGKARSTDPDRTQALRTLFEARPRLSASQSRRAQRLLARPTDGARDPAQMGYTTASQRVCGVRVCVHWVTRGKDRAPNRRWVTTTLKTMDRVAKRTRKLGWPAPAKDGSRGGNAKLDVYLKDLGTTKTYGYCVGEKRLSRQPARATSYCVLDNDFSPRQYFGNKAINSLRVTAAHEYFHTVQFAMDHREDAWFMESTATWMEEQLYDGINDNRQYLPSSQIATPWRPLDTVDTAGRQYSGWIFWEYLSHRYSKKIVRRVWKAAARKGVTSTTALRRVLATKGGLDQVFADYLAATAQPTTFWPEGRAYRRYRPTQGALAPFDVNGPASATVSLDHLSGYPYRIRPAANLSPHGQLQITVTAPVPRAIAATVLIQHSSGKLERRTVPMNAAGKGSVTVAFGRGKVPDVVVALANASTRYDCNMNTSWSCRGVPRDDDRQVTLRIVPVA